MARTIHAQVLIRQTGTAGDRRIDAPRLTIDVRIVRD
jgi:hypothetical protein